MSLLRALQLPSPARAAAAGPPAAGGDRLAQAAQAWRDTHRLAEERIAALREAVRARCADAPPAFVREVEQGLGKLDRLLGPLDTRLAQSLAKAAQAGDAKARAAELKTAKALVAEYIGHVKAEPLIAHVDQNPFDVATDLKTLLTDGLAQAGASLKIM
jgi:hypothetical protein